MKNLEKHTSEKMCPEFCRDIASSRHVENCEEERTKKILKCVLASRAPRPATGVSWALRPKVSQGVSLRVSP